MLQTQSAETGAAAAAVVARSGPGQPACVRPPAGIDHGRPSLIHDQAAGSASCAQLMPLSSSGARCKTNRSHPVVQLARSARDAPCRVNGLRLAVARLLLARTSPDRRLRQQLTSVGTPPSIWYRAGAGRLRQLRRGAFAPWRRGQSALWLSRPRDCVRRAPLRRLERSSPIAASILAAARHEHPRLKLRSDDFDGARLMCARKRGARAARPVLWPVAGRPERRALTLPRVLALRRWRSRYLPGRVATGRDRTSPSACRTARARIPSRAARRRSTSSFEAANSLST